MKLLWISFMLCLALPSTRQSLLGSWFETRTEDGNNSTETQDRLAKLESQLEALKQKHLDGIRQVLRSDPKRNKRDLEIKQVTSDEKGVYKLTGVQPLTNIPVNKPFDIELFHYLGFMYALVADQSDRTRWSTSAMFRFNEETGNFDHIIDLEQTNSAIDWSSFLIGDEQYVVAAEYNSSKDPNAEHPGSVVYKFVPSETENQLLYVQTLKTSFPTHIQAWTDENDIPCLAIANSKTVEDGETKYEVASVIYRWQGAHFDQFSSITTYNAQSLIIFRIHDHVFLAAANHRNDAGEYSIDSEIFIYNIDRQDFESFQKIKTHGAKDWEFFSFGKGTEEEFFLVVANMYEGDEEHKNYKVDSVIYKFAGSHFVPFQCIPTHGAEQWMAIKGNRDQFLLAVANSDGGLGLYSYNGWRFVETGVQYTSDALSRGIHRLSWVVHDDRYFLAAANLNQMSTSLYHNVFELQWFYTQELAEFHAKTEAWCESRRILLEKTNADDLLDGINGALKINADQIVIDGNLNFAKDVWIERIKTSKITDLSTGMTYDHTIISRLWELYQRIMGLKDRLNAISDYLKRALRTVGDQSITGSYNFETADFSNVVNTNDIEVNTLNGVDASQLEKSVVYLDKEHVFNFPLTFKDGIRVVSSLRVDGYVDGVKVSDLVTLSGDHDIQAEKTFVGNVKSPSMLVSGTVDGIEVSEQNLLLTIGNQNISGSLMFSDISVPSLNVAGEISGVDIDWLYDETVLTHGGHFAITGSKTFADPIYVYTDVTALGGVFVNGVYLDELDQSAMRIDRDQRVIGDHSYNYVNVGGNIDVTGLINGVVIPSDKAMVLDGTYTVVAPKTFLGDVWFDDLIVTSGVNGLEVFEDGSLDVMLKHGDQIVTGHKTFKSLFLSGNSPVNGLVDGVHLPSLLNNSLTIHGDQVVTGHIDLRGSLSVDRLSLGGLLDGVDLDHMFNHALRLDNQEIPSSVNLKFAGPVQAQYLEATTINGLDLANDLWLKNEPSHLGGHKVFRDDIILKKPLHVRGLINGIDIQRLADDTLYVDGDQIIAAPKNLLEDVDFTKGVNVKGMVDGIDLADTVFLDDVDIVFTGKKTFNDMKVNNLKAGRMMVNGTVNKVNFYDLVNNTLFSSGNQVIAGKKHVDKLTVDTMNVLGLINGMDFKEMMKDIIYIDQDGEIVAPKTFTDHVKISDLVFSDTLDGLTDADIRDGWMMQGVDQVVTSHITFEGDVSTDDVRVSGLVNDVDVEEMASQSIRLDEDAELSGPFHFAQVVSHGDVEVNGLVNGIKLSRDAVTVDEPASITGSKHFIAPTLIEGNLEVAGLIDGVDVEALCDNAVRRDSNQEILGIKINGHLEVEQDLLVKGLVNGIDIVELNRTAMRVDADQVVEGRKNFVGGASFNDLRVTGLVDGINLQDVLDSYMSLTAAQTVTGKLLFNRLSVLGDLNSKTMTVGGLLNGVDIELFSKSVLLDYGDQKLDGTFVFGGPTTILGDVSVNGLVDGVKIPDQVLIIGNDNTVTGYKQFTNVHVRGNLDMVDGALVQGVDLSEWASKVVFKDRDTMIAGQTTFNEVDMKYVTVDGTFDDVVFSKDNLLIDGLDQIVTGLKTIEGIEIDDELNVGGLIDGVDLETLFSTAVTIDAPENRIQKAITLAVPPVLTDATTYAKVDGVIIRDLLKRLSVNFPTETLSNITNSLDARANAILDALSRQPMILDYYCHGYEEFNVEGSRWDYIDIPYGMSGVSLVSQNCDNECTSINLYYWEEKNKFTLLQILPSSKAVGVVSLANGKYLVVADGKLSSDCVDASRMGRMNLGSGGSLSVYAYDTAQKYSLVSTIPIGRASDVRSFSLPGIGRECVIVAIEKESGSTHVSSPIYCLNEMTGDLELFTSVQTANAKQVAVSAFGSTAVYFAVANYEAWLDVYAIIDSQLVKIQALPGIEFKKVKMISDGNELYLLTVSRRKQTAVQLYKFDRTINNFVLVQTLDHSDVIDIEMTILPTKELTVYVLVDCNTHPNLYIYTLRGATGLRQRTDLTIWAPGAQSLLTFRISANDSYYLAYASSKSPGRTDARSMIHKAIFKGNKL